jgi:hypothetical protein
MTIFLAQKRLVIKFHIDFDMLLKFNTKTLISIFINLKFRLIWIIFIWY